MYISIILYALPILGILLLEYNTHGEKMYLFYNEKWLVNKYSFQLNVFTYFAIKYFYQPSLSTIQYYTIQYYTVFVLINATINCLVEKDIRCF